MELWLLGLAGWILLPLPLAILVGRTLSRGSHPLPIDARRTTAPIDVDIPVAPAA